MILSSVIYSTYSLHDKNIPDMIGGKGHVMPSKYFQWLNCLK